MFNVRTTPTHTHISRPPASYRPSRTIPKHRIPRLPFLASPSTPPSCLPSSPPLSPPSTCAPFLDEDLGISRWTSTWARAPWRAMRLTSLAATRRISCSTWPLPCRCSLPRLILHMLMFHASRSCFGTQVGVFQSTRCCSVVDLWLRICAFVSRVH